MPALLFIWLGACALGLIGGIVLLVRGPRLLRLVGLGLAFFGVAFAMVCAAVSLESQRMVSDAMAPTLRTGDRFVVLKLRYEPHVGDVVVVRPPEGAETESCGVSHERGQICPAPSAGRAQANYVARIVAGPGDRVTMRGGRATVDGRPEDAGAPRTACRDATRCDFPVGVEIPEEHWLLLNDARGEADDSRIWGPVHEDAIVGRMWIRSGPSP